MEAHDDLIVTDYAIFSSVNFFQNILKPLNSHDAAKHHFTSQKNNLISYGVFFMELF